MYLHNSALINDPSATSKIELLLFVLFFHDMFSYSQSTDLHAFFIRLKSSVGTLV